MKLLLKNILLPKDGGTEKTDICIDGNRILSIGRVPENFAPDRTVEGNSKLLCIPALINAHTHAYMTVLRNCADDLPFEEWLFNGVMPRENAMTNEEAYQSSLLGCCEMIRHGTGTFCDMHMFPDSSARAAYETGMRAVITRGLSGSDDGQRRIDEQFAEIERWKDEKRLSFMLAPHAIYTCDRPYLEKISKLAKEHSLGIHTHLSESLKEVDDCMKEHGMTPVEYLDSLSLLSENTLAAHCVHVSDNDIKILAGRKVSIAANPKSNAKLGNGIAPVRKFLNAGINVCLGTDSAASNNCLNMFSEMNYTALIHKANDRDSTSVSARNVFDFATKNGAKALHIKNLGEIKEGYLADIALINTDCPQLTPLKDPYSALCYCMDGSETETLIIDGKIVMEKREIKTIDEEKLLYNIKKNSKEV